MVWFGILFSILMAPSRLWGQNPSGSNQPAQKPVEDDARAAEMSSSKDTRIDLTPPRDDAKNHPDSGVAIVDAEGADSPDVGEFHAWDPHKAAKDVEVGDFYFKKKNYRAALDRYQEALTYKPNDAIATIRLAECEEKIGKNDDAITHYQAYLNLLPHGPFAADAQKSLDRLKAAAPKQSRAHK